MEEQLNLLGWANREQKRKQETGKPTNPVINA
jgi:hypothetical protein